MRYLLVILGSMVVSAWVLLVVLMVDAWREE